MLIGAPLQKLRHSVRSHPLKGVEPELFSPEELLGGARRASPSTSRPAFGSQTPPQHQPAFHRSDSESSDRQQSGSWFQLPWKVSQQDEAPQSRRISRDDRGLPLNQPPLVSLLCHRQELFSGRAFSVIAKCIGFAKLEPLIQRHALQKPPLDHQSSRPTCKGCS